MAIYLGTNELGGGGGGAAIGDLALKPAANKANTYVDSNGLTWLKTGVVETTLATYPDAPLTRAGSEVASWATHFNGGYSNYGVEYDSLNNVGIIRSGSYISISNTVDTIDTDANGDPDGTFTNATFGTSTYSTPPLSDGTDNWIAMHDGTASQHTGPRYGNFSVGNTFGANNIVFKKATGGTYGSYTTTDTGKVSTSGYTARTTANWDGAYNEAGHVVSSIGITDDHFYVGAHGYGTQYAPTSYAVYYYNLHSGYVVQSYTIKYNKSDGSFAEVILDKLPINDSGSNKVFLIDATHPYTGTTKTVEHVATNGNILLDFTITKSSETYQHITPRMYSDNNSIFYVLDSAGTHSPGTFDKYEEARGYSKSLYARGLTDSTIRTQTGSGPIGPYQTSEMSGEPLYMRVL